MKAIPTTLLLGLALLPGVLPAASPVAEAGPDIEIADVNDDESVIVVLDASATTDTDGDIVSYAWSWAGGSADGEVTDGTFPSTDAPVTVTLTVTDAASNVSIDTLSVTAFRKETALFTDFEGRLGTSVSGTIADETLVIREGSFHDGVHRRVAGNWIYDPIPDFVRTSRVVDSTTFLTGASELGSQFYPYTVVRFDGSDWIESPLTYPAEIIPKADPADFQSLQYAIDPQTFVVSDRDNNLYGAFGGRVFVYDWVGDTLTFKTELLPPGGVAAGDSWGNKVALEDDLIVATIEHSSGDGADLEIFRNVAGTWTHEATVVSNDPSGRGFSDFELSIGNERILVGGTDSDGVAVIEKVGANWIQTTFTSATFGITSFFGYQMNDDGEAFIADDEAANVILFEKDAASASWSTATVTETRLLASDLTPRRELSVTGFDDGLAVVSDRNLGVVRVYDTATYRAGINAEPVADAGADITTTSFDGEGVRVFLNGGLSRDLNNDDVLGATWSWAGGSASGLQTFATLDPSVTSVELTITDGAGGVSRDTLAVNIESPPVLASLPDISVVDTDVDGNILLKVNGTVESQDNPIAAWNWTWPGGTFSGQSGVLTLGEPSNGKVVTLEVIDANGLVSRSQFTFNLLQEEPLPDFIVPNDGVSLDRFGSSVAISDGTAIINAADKLSDGTFTGATYLSENINDVWQQLRLANGQAAGSAVVLDGEFAFVGAARYSDGVANRVGAVRIFENQVGGWVQVDLLEIPEAVTPFYADFNFGATLAKSGDWLAVGTPGDNDAASRAGSVFLYELVGGTWTFRQKLLPPAPFNVAFNSFGNTLAMRGDTLVVGSERTNGSTNDSAAFVYERSGASWNYVQTLTSDAFEAPGSIDDFAYSLAVSDSEILVGASLEGNDVANESSRGVVYRYTRSGPTWTFAGKILPVNDTEFGSARFGWSLFFEDGHLLVGDPFYVIQEGSIRGRGQVYVFREETAGWTLVDRISVTNEIDPTITSNQRADFGISIAHDGSDLIVGASSGWNADNRQTGKAFIFRNYAALNPDANYEPLADAGTDLATTDALVRDAGTDEITEPLGSELVTLDGSGSSDEENGIVSWEWSWDGGSASGEVVQARFPVGTTTVLLTVTDDAGFVNTDTVEVTVTLLQTAPAALASTEGNTFTVDLPVAAARWRLSNEFLWHESLETITGIVPGEPYQVEVIGYAGSSEVITALATPQAGNSVADFNLLVPLPPATTGRISFPETEVGFSWRLTGEDTWRDVTDNGDTVEDVLEFTLPTGPTRIEFRPVQGYITPSPRTVTVQAGVTQGLNWGDYALISNFNSSKTFDLAPNPNLQGDPYQYVGMIRTPLGRATGTVVADRVVLTAAHPFFDFSGLKWENTQWFPRQEQDVYQAPPVAPRGILFRTSYAKLIAPDSVPGNVANLPEDIQEVDFACLYFNDATWTGGSANFLQSTGERNWLTGPENKHAVGYAQRNQSYPDRGRLYEKTFTTPLNVLDTLGKLYESPEVFGDGGASGSALFVEPAGTGQAYPAAILLAGQNRAVYRVIDLEVTRMIKDAADTATGNGDVLDSSSSLVTFDSLGSFATLGVSISPAPIAENVRWAVEPNAGAGFANVKAGQTVPFNPDWDSFTIRFNAVPGYATPPPIVRPGSTILPSTSTTFDATYEPLSGYDYWKQDNLLAGDTANGDGDMWIALWEYALDLDPAAADFRIPIRAADPPTQHSFAEFEVYVSATADAIRYEVVAANSLEDLEQGTNLTSLGSFTKAHGSSDYLTVTDETQPLSASPTRFARVIITHDRSLSAP